MQPHPKGTPALVSKQGMSKEQKYVSLAMLPCFTDSVSERLRRWTRNPLGSARRGSNPLAVDYVSFREDDGVLQGGAHEVSRVCLLL